MFGVVASLSSETADGSNTDIEVGDLRWTNAGLCDLELFTTYVHAIECIKCRLIGGGRVNVLGEGDSLVERFRNCSSQCENAQNLLVTPRCYDL